MMNAEYDIEQESECGQAFERAFRDRMRETPAAPNLNFMVGGWHPKAFRAESERLVEQLYGEGYREDPQRYGRWVCLAIAVLAILFWVGLLMVAWEVLAR